MVLRIEQALELAAACVHAARHFGFGYVEHERVKRGGERLPVTLACGVFGFVQVSLVALSVLSLGACAHSPAPDCDVSDITAVFASPTRYVGHRFCGEGFYYGAGELGGVYDRPVETEEQRYSTAILMTAGSGRFVGFGRGDEENVRVIVSGAIADVCTDGREGEASCVPVRTAIFLEGWEVRRAVADR